MGWQRSHAVPGPRLSSPHACLPIWSGGARTSILYALTNHCAWRSCSHANAGTNAWRNETSNVRKLWQREEPTDDGRLVRCSLAPCQRCPLEKHQSQIWAQEYVAGRLVNVLLRKTRMDP